MVNSIVKNQLELYTNITLEDNIEVIPINTTTIYIRTHEYMICIFQTVTKQTK